MITKVRSIKKQFFLENLKKKKIDKVIKVKARVYVNNINSRGGGRGGDMSNVSI